LLGYLPVHYQSYIKMRKIRQGKALDKVLDQTARNILIFGIVSMLAILL